MGNEASQPADESVLAELHIAVDEGRYGDAQRILYGRLTKTQRNEYIFEQLSGPQVLEIVRDVTKIRDEEGETLLHRKTDIAEELITRGVDINDKNNMWGITPLHKAVERGDAKMVDILIKAGVELDANQYDSGRTALEIAAQRSDLPIVKLLIEAGAYFDYNTLTMGFVTDPEVAAYIRRKRKQKKLGDRRVALLRGRLARAGEDEHKEGGAVHIYPNRLNPEYEQAAAHKSSIEVNRKMPRRDPSSSNPFALKDGTWYHGNGGAWNPL